MGNITCVSAGQSCVCFQRVHMLHNINAVHATLIILQQWLIAHPVVSFSILSVLCDLDIWLALSLVFADFTNRVEDMRLQDLAEGDSKELVSQVRPLVALPKPVNYDLPQTEKTAPLNVLKTGIGLQ